MRADKDTDDVCVHRASSPGLDVITLDRRSYKEYFITATPNNGESVQSLFQRAADSVRANNAQVISQEVFGISDEDGTNLEMLQEILGGIDAPVTWIQDGHEKNLFGTHLWAVSGLTIRPVKIGERVVGSLFEDDYAQYCRLGGLLPSDARQSRSEQASEVFEQMDSVLQNNGMEFGHVVRTWFYNYNILDWYGDFNRVRDAFFQKKHVYEGLLPASTGVGGRNTAGMALAGGLFAMKPKIEGVSAFTVRSPLQDSATQYGSSFSRAVEVDFPDHRRLWVSGSASIEASGKTAHVGNPKKQVRLTMEVVHAILKSRDMGWADTTRALAYFKYAEDSPNFEEFRTEFKLPRFPVVVVQNDVCRDELLFEIEVDAVRPNK